MQWIKAENKPMHDILAFVYNSKGWINNYILANYHHRYDVWVINSRDGRDTYTLEITHYCPAPDFPKDE